MPFIGTRRVLRYSGALSYSQKLLTIAPANLIGYWRLNETAGAQATDSSTQGNNGAYTGVDLANAAGPDGVLCPYFDGANDNVDVSFVPFIADFSLTEGSAAVWCKVNSIAVWTDNVQRNAIGISDGLGLFIQLCKWWDGSALVLRYGASVHQSMIQPVDWIHLALTWSQSANKVCGYVAGVELLPELAFPDPLTGLNGGAEIGSAGGLAKWHGWLAHACIWNTPLTAAQILSLATI